MGSTLCEKTYKWITFLAIEFDSICISRNFHPAAGHSLPRWVCLCGLACCPFTTSIPGKSTEPLGYLMDGKGSK